MNKLCFAVFLLLLFSGDLLTAFAQGTVKNKNYLFKIERNRDADEIYYEANLTDDGRLIQEQPIQVYWVKHTANGKTEPLTKVQNSMSYGIKFLDISSEKTEFQLVSFDQTMTLRKNSAGEYKVFTWFDNQESEVERIFIWFSNKSYWFPKVGRVECYAKNAKTNETLTFAITR